MQKKHPTRPKKQLSSSPSLTCLASLGLIKGQGQTLYLIQPPTTTKLFRSILSPKLGRGRGVSTNLNNVFKSSVFFLKSPLTERFYVDFLNIFPMFQSQKVPKSPKLLNHYSAQKPFSLSSTLKQLYLFETSRKFIIFSTGKFHMGFLNQYLKQTSLVLIFFYFKHFTRLLDLQNMTNNID